MTGPSTYGEGERVFGPPSGSFDADWVAAAAQSDDPGLTRDDAQRLAARAWQLLREGQDLGTLGNDAVARAVREWCDLYGVG